jgi:hypothetical protein
VIEKPMGFVVMEAMRLRDEATRNFPIVDTDITRKTIAARESERPGKAPSILHQVPRALTTPPPAPPKPDAASLRRGYVHAPAGAYVLAVVEGPGGAVLACDGKERSSVTETALVAANLLGTVRRAIDASAKGDGVEEVQEIVVATRSRYDLIRPLPDSPDAFAMLVFDPAMMNLVIARLELDHAVATYLATCTMYA